MFPGWLYHAVLPLVLPRGDGIPGEGTGGGTGGGTGEGDQGGDAEGTVRISAAFNVVFEGHEPAGVAT